MLSTQGPSWFPNSAEDNKFQLELAMTSAHTIAGHRHSVGHCLASCQTAQSHGEHPKAGPTQRLVWCACHDSVHFDKMLNIIQ